MNIASIRPSTVDGIKQLAIKIKRERKVSHTDALEAASRQAGFENYVHAKRQIASAPRVFPVYLSAHWQVRRADRSPAGPRAGREHLRVDLSRPLADVVARHRVDAARGLTGFRMEYLDHLEHRTDLIGQDGARDALLTAARSLRFMEATGLQPITTQKLREQARQLAKIPKNDHLSYWFDPDTDAVLVLDEPYKNTVLKSIDERMQWLSKMHLAIRSPNWEGIYYPGECPPHLISADEDLVERVATALAKVPPVVEIDPWPHQTASHGDAFISPQRMADNKQRKPRPGPSYRDYKGATPYGGGPGIRSSWRPSVAMPIDLHHRLGQLMQSLSEIDFSYRVSTKILRYRSMLEDWMSLEHGLASSNDVYYGGTHRNHLLSDVERLKALSEAKAIIERGYNDCKPRKELIATLEAAVAEIARSSKS